MTPFQKHVADWKDCQRCPLAKQRDRICLARGKITADIVLVGEAPGDSENAIGQPFIGPAGQELDRWVEAAFDGKYRLLMTNLVACFPREAKAAKVNEPNAAEIKACEPRLRELIKIANPKMIVAVGQLADKHLKKMALGIPLTAIIHPAAVLRAPLIQQSLLAQKAVVTMRCAAKELLQ